MRSKMMMRVGRDADRQDHAGEAGQRQRHVEDEDRRVEERGVDAEAEHRDEAEEAVRDQEEDRHEHHARDRRPQRLVQRVLAERRRDLRLRQRLEADGQGSRLEHEGEVLRLGERVEAGDLRTVRAADAAGVVSKSIDGNDLISSSSTIAKLWLKALDRPLWAAVRL